MAPLPMSAVQPTNPFNQTQGSITGRSQFAVTAAMQTGGGNVRAKLLALDDMVEVLGHDLGVHKREVQVLRSEKESLEKVLNTKTTAVHKTLTTELKKVENDMKRHYHGQKEENLRVQAQVSNLKAEKTSLDMQLMELERRMAELELQLGHDASHI